MNAVDFLGHCIENAPRIYVREKINGQWGSFSLAEMPGDYALAHVRRWLVEGRMPVMVRETGERIPAAAAAEVQKPRGSEGRSEGQPPVLNKSGGSGVEAPWPLCSSPEGCLVAVIRPGGLCSKHGGPEWPF